MADADSFKVDPERITTGSAVITELGSYAWSILAEFREAMNDTSWCGNDTSGQKIRANFVENRGSVVNSLESLGEVLQRTGEATLQNLQTTQDTLGENIDSIGEQAGRYGGRRG